MVEFLLNLKQYNRLIKLIDFNKHQKQDFLRYIN